MLERSGRPTASRSTGASRRSTTSVMTRPVQQPRPPLWLGAMSDAGIARPRGWAMRGSSRPPRRWPRCRSSSRCSPRSASASAGRWGGCRSVARSSSGAPATTPGARRRDGAGLVRQHGRHRQPPLRRVPDRGGLGALGLRVRLGRRRRRRDPAIGDRVPVDPVLTRAHWPGMTSEQAVANIDSLGRELVPALRGYVPVRDLPESRA